MIAYTGIETVSNLAEEARDPPRDIPRSISWVAGAVFAIYFTLPLIALSALPVHRVDGGYATLLGEQPTSGGGGGFANDPVLGVVEHLGLHGTVLSVAKIYVGILAATILFIATNAGVIGASRITYAMAGYRQIPEVFRRLHPRFKTPWLSLARLRPDSSRSPFCCPAGRRSSGTCTRSGRCFVHDCARSRSSRCESSADDREMRFRARPNLRIGGVDWPLFAIFGGARDGGRLAGGRRPEGGRPLGRPRLADPGADPVHDLPALCGPCGAARNGAGARF